MDEFDPRILRFFKYADHTCEEAGVLIETEDSKYLVLRNEKVYGYFTPPTQGPPLTFGRIRIALQSGYPDPLHSLVHEFAHFTQWSEGSEAWQVRQYMYDRFVQITARKKKIPNIERVGVRRSIRALELDCERRAVQIIKTWDLPLDVAAYIQYANVHIWWQTLAIEHAASGSRRPFRTAVINPSIVALCPKEFLEIYDDVPEFIRLACLKKS